MNTNKDEIVRTLEAGVHYLLLNQPIDYVADEKNRIKGLKIKRTRLGAEDVSGRRSPEIIDGSEWILDTDIVIEAIGNIPEKDSFQLYPNVKINDKKLIQTDPETMQTLVKGVFAGGDIVRGPSFVVNAVCDGKAAARAIKAYLDKKQEVGTE
jgi:NADPH-dependent glutamate synthase beta subunit-like oxidoreductase